ncbi:MAG: hypothetical protein JWQ40_332 [Segetibacter sp.]|nr:hypothetical protein [Segetibacter sp.]
MRYTNTIAISAGFFYGPASAVMATTVVRMNPFGGVGLVKR